jgi:hypothetical protein
VSARSWREYKLSAPESYTRLDTPVACIECAVWIIHLSTDVTLEEFKTFVVYLLNHHAQKFFVPLPQVQHCRFYNKKCHSIYGKDQYGYVEFGDPGGVQTLLDAYRLFEQAAKGNRLRGGAIERKIIRPYFKSMRGHKYLHMVRYSFNNKSSLEQLAFLFETR